MSGRGIPRSPEPADSYRCQVTNTHRSSLASRPQTGRLPMSATGERWSACVPPPGAADRMLAQAGPVEGLPRPPLALHCSVHCKPNKHANTADAAHPGRGPSRVPRSGALARPPASAVRHGLAGATTILSRSAAGPSAGAGMPPPLPLCAFLRGGCCGAQLPDSALPPADDGEWSGFEVHLIEALSNSTDFGFEVRCAACAPGGAARRRP